MSNRSSKLFLKRIHRFNPRLWRWNLIRKYVSLLMIGLILSWCGLACSPSPHQRSIATQNLETSIAKATTKH